jgi:CRP-like cAMP-binding protein
MGGTTRTKARTTIREPAFGVPWSSDVAEFLKKSAMVVRAKQGQSMPLSTGTEGIVYYVRSGSLAFQSSIPGRRRLILCLLFPGDLFETTCSPALPDASLHAMCGADVLKTNLRALMDILAAGQGLARSTWNKLQAQKARLILHNTMIGALTGEERTAALLLELGLRLGTPVDGGTAFALPLSRTDIADYLALNPDTLSRHFSRLKSLGIIQQTGRSQTKILDWPALRRECPIADAIELLHQKSR